MTAPTRDWLPGVHESPNIQVDPDGYEIENRAADPGNRIEAAMRAIAGWDGRDVLDLGAGTGYHIPGFAAGARHVYVVEPHDRSRLLAMERCVQLGVANASVLAGSAESIPLREGAVDIVHARFAYFWGPGSEPGIAEMRRVLRPGGTGHVIDNHLRSGTFAEWLRRADPGGGRDPDRVEGFWRDQGFTLTRIPTSWHFERREDLERVMRLEFPADLAGELLDEHPGVDIDYHFALYSRTFGRRARS